MKRLFPRLSGRQLAKSAAKSFMIVVLCMFCLPLAFGMVCALPRKFADRTAALFVFAFGTVISGPTIMSMLAPFADVLDDVSLSGADMFRSTCFKLLALFAGYLIVRLSRRSEGFIHVGTLSVSRTYAYGVMSAVSFIGAWMLVDADRGNVWSSVAEIASAIETADAAEQRALGNLVQKMGGSL